MSNYGPQVPFCDELHAQKYRSEGETFREAMNRVASALADNPDHFEKLQDILLNMRFMPAGRIQTAMGSTKTVTPYNCYVSGTIQDSFVEGDGNIMQRAAEAAATMRMGGGIGYDFSTLRPRGAFIKKLQSRSSGPVSFMHIFDAICRCVASSGHRRGAQMGVMRVDHPNIEDFIHAKNNQTQLTGFNISVAITDEFMESVATGKPFALRFAGEVYNYVDPRQLWDTIMRSTWDWAEPGVLFIDQINRMNNLYYCESIAATNPCGEQPLPPYGACLLGSFNLTKYLQRIDQNDNEEGRLMEKIFGSRYRFDWDQLAEDIPHVVRAMDNVIDKAIYPLPQQEAEAKSKRRMGLGITGLANAGEVLGDAYGSPDFVDLERRVLRWISGACYNASALLAKEKGAFPMFSRDKYLAGQYVRTLHEGTRDLIYKHGIRNSHLTSIAPTGTIALCADNISSGIEPVFEYEFDRTVIEFDGPRKETVQDYGVRVLGVRGKRAAEVTVKEHIDVLVTAQQYVDSAVSKTCNVPSSVSWEEFKNIYMDAWSRGAKGCATFRINGKRAGVLETKDEGASCRIDTTTGKRECE